MGLNALVGDDDNLAILDLAYKVCADNVQRAGFRRQHISVAKTAEHQRAQADRVARADQFLACQANKGIAAFNTLERIGQPVQETRTAGAGNEVQDHLGIHGRLEDGAVAHKVMTDLAGIGQVAIVSDSKAAAGKVCKDRLDVAEHRPALRGITVVADGCMTGQAGAKVTAKVLTHHAHMAFGRETLAVERNDTTRFLSAVLQRVQAKSGQKLAS